ncbi:MAG: DUF488 family protein [Xanthobacteraceae bacterium]|nr:DUF488 family protein [Xanthobacteraceae bacterium]
MVPAVTSGTGKAAAGRKRTAKRRLEVKRVYDAPGPADGARILVDRVWPRGLTRKAAALDLWLRDIAPSTPLRKWFGHRPERWKQFCRRYGEELRDDPFAVAALERWMDKGSVTLVFSAKDRDHNNAVALKAYLGRARRRHTTSQAAARRSRRA